MRIMICDGGIMNIAEYNILFQTNANAFGNAVKL